MTMKMDSAIPAYNGTKTDKRCDGICRLCLAVNSPNMMSLFDEPVVLNEITTCFSIRISPSDPFPKQICQDCKERIENIHKYRKKVVANERTLLANAYTGLDGLHKYYSALKHTRVKAERRESINFKVEGLEDSNGVDSKSDYETETEGLKDENEIKVTDDIKKENQSTVKSILDDSKKLYEPKNKAKQNIDKKTDAKIIEDISADNDENDLIDPKGNKFKCLTCFELLNTKAELLAHYNSKHKPKEVTGKAKFEELDEGGILKFKCSECAKVFKTRKAARSHLRSHGAGISFICKLCGRTYMTACEIARHGRAHDGSRVFCSQNCGYSTPYLGALIQHEKRHKGDDFKYKCEECGKGFQVKTWFLQHQNIHKGLKPFICDICGVSFHMDRYLTAHKSSVHPATARVRRYACPHCSLPCHSRKAFTDHLKEHGIRTSYLCDLCGKTLSNAEQLKFHKRVHLGVRPYSCSTCDKTFTKKFNLQLHERTHTGEKSHECHTCGKHYSQRSTLLRHNNRHHSQAKQHKCTNCRTSYNTPELLASHMKLCI